MLHELMFPKHFDSFFATPNLFKVDLKRNSTGYELRAELPGFTKDEVKVTFDRGILGISAERKENEVKDEENFYLKEITSGTFERKFRLPDVDSEKIEVSLKDGVLTVKAPLKEKASPKVIQIKD